jgi:predicted cupin superfamily sugar epimerase
MKHQNRIKHGAPRQTKGGKVALLDCTVTPGFDFADYRCGGYAELAEK